MKPEKRNQRKVLGEDLVNPSQQTGFWRTVLLRLDAEFGEEATAVRLFALLNYLVLL